MIIEASRWWKLQQHICVALMLLIVLHISVNLWVAIRPFLGVEMPDMALVDPAPSHYLDGGSDFGVYALEVRDHLRRYRIPVEHQSYTPQVQTSWVAPYTQEVSRHCGTIRGRALLIHGLYGSAYQMSDIADALSKSCYESDVMLLPGHGTRPSDLHTVSAEDYLESVSTRLQVFRRSCRNCVVVGYSMGALLASLALAQDSGHIHGFVAIAPAWETNFSNLSGFLPLVRRFLDYSPVSRRKPLPTHYSHESLHAVEQLYELISQFEANLLSANPKQVPIPGLVIVAEDDEVIPFGYSLDISLHHFAQPPNFILFSDGSQGWEDSLGSSGALNVSTQRSAWPELGIVSLSHFGLVYSPDNFLYGFGGIYGRCMEPSGFECDEIPVEPRYGTRNPEPEPDEALASSHPEFSRMMATIVQFLDRHSLIER